MSKAEEFIARHQMGYQNIQIAELMETYLQEMEKGLAGAPSSLLMLPTYLQLEEEVCRCKKVVCVDAGGTNLRICLAEFDAEGNFVMEQFQRGTMPGVEKELSAAEFFDVMAQIIAPYCTETRDVVMSFAYRAKSTEEIDAEIVEITKEVKVRGAGGKKLAAGIKASLARMGVADVDMIIINDTVAAALSGKADHLNDGYGAFTGTILGTGSNSCYLEANANITKLFDDNRMGAMLINTEAGSYDKLPRSDIDLAYSKTTHYPDIGAAEKMSSGAYLGALCEYTLKSAAKEEVFETKGVEKIIALKSEDVSEFLTDRSGIIAEYMVNEEDEQNAYDILNNIVLRAARLTALQMAAIAEKSCKTNNSLCMSIEGSTYEKMTGLKGELQSQLGEYLGTRGLEADLITVEKAVLKGCAIAGLSRSRECL